MKNALQLDAESAWMKLAKHTAGSSFRNPEHVAQAAEEDALAHDQRAPELDTYLHHIHRKSEPTMLTSDEAVSPSVLVLCTLLALSIAASLLHVRRWAGQQARRQPLLEGFAS